MLEMIIIHSLTAARTIESAGEVLERAFQMQ